MDEAQNLADRVAILAAGRVVAAGTPDSLGGRDEGEAMISFRLPAGAAVADLPARPAGPAGAGRGPGGAAHHRAHRRPQPPHRLGAGPGEELDALTVTRPSLEDVYLRLTGGPATRSRPMPDPPARADGRPDLALLWRQVRAQNRLFLRNPFSAFFSLAFPVMFLLLFGSLNGGGRIEELGGIRYIQFLAPGMLAFAVISTCYTGLVTGVAINRDEGLLKRVRGTPLPPWVYITARIRSAVWFSMVSAVVMVVAAVLLFRVEVIGRMLPAAVVTLLLGRPASAPWAWRWPRSSPTARRRPVIANFTFFPIAFVSDLFFPTAGAPAWVGTVGSIFPVKHFAVALENTFNPFGRAAGSSGGTWACWPCGRSPGWWWPSASSAGSPASGRRAAAAAGPGRPGRRGRPGGLGPGEEVAVAVRLADLLAGLSRLADLGFGLQAGEALRSCALATRLARSLDLPDDDVRAAFYTALLHHVGCTGYAHETARLFGDELVLNVAAGRQDAADPRDLFATFLPLLTRGGRRWSGPGWSWPPSPRAAASPRPTPPRPARSGGTRPGAWACPRRSSAASTTSTRTGGGGGVPAGLAGDDLPAGSRLARLTGIAVLFDTLGGVEAAVDAVRRRGGGMLDPGMAAAFADRAEALLGEINASDPRALALEAEPRPVVSVPDRELAEVARPCSPTWRI